MTNEEKIEAARKALDTLREFIDQVQQSK